MLCITGAEKTVSSLSKRLARHPDADLQEIRLDLLGDLLTSIAGLDFDPRHLLLTCRAKREGGGFEGPEERRLEQLRSLLSFRPGWIDIELSTPSELRQPLIAQARQQGTKVLISHHLLDPGQANQAQMLSAELSITGADGTKLAVQVQDACELVHLWSIGTQAKPNTVLTGMGPAGLLSRALYPRFGSAWTYAASRKGEETAAGQLAAADFEQWRLPPKAGTPLYVLLGGPQVMHSPGPRVYNRLFSALGIQALYLPVITREAGQTLDLLKNLGFKGASVTMPLKKTMTTWMDNLGEEARAAGAVNTVTYEKSGKLRGDLTDGLGAKAALERVCGSLPGKRAIILGTGGTATAVAHSLTVAGVKVTILGRDVQKAYKIAGRLSINAGGLDDLAHIGFDILVQATPVGADNPEDTLVPEARLLADKIVLDVVLDKDTRLLRDTRKAGGTAVPGRSMWAEQGKLQLARWLELSVETAELEKDP